MKKVLHVAWRELIATVTTKAFILAVLVVPLLLGAMAVLLPILLKEEPPKIDGEFAVLDPSGEVTAGVREYLTPEAMAQRREEFQQKVEEEIPEAVRELSGAAGPGSTGPGSSAFDQALQEALGEVPDISVTALPPGTQLEAEKKALLAEPGEGGNGRLALAVIHEDAVDRREGEKGFGAYDLFVREKLDDRITDELREALHHSIVDARIRHEGYDPEEIEALTHLPRVRPTAVSAEGEREANEILNVLLPMGFMLLLLMSVMTGGQQLMTSMIEEKSSRVVEVLLSAVSPMQLMAGKILGQMAVGFIILALYSALGIAALVSFAFLGLVDPMLFAYLILFYVIAYFVIASLMAAIGAAVNEVREAQSLLTPVMLVIFIPWMLWMPISRDPNSVLATVLSLTPPVNSFVMMLRLTSSTPPPGWQVWLSILIGVASVFGAIWFAGKVFRVGLLMFGKPPNMRTLMRWVRMA